jgi:hypothetical protein
MPRQRHLTLEKREDRRGPRREEEEQTERVHQDNLPPWKLLLLTDPHLARSVNAEQRAALLQAGQQVFGNRAVQRLLHPDSEQTTPPVQGQIEEEEETSQAEELHVQGSMMGQEARFGPGPHTWETIAGKQPSEGAQIAALPRIAPNAIQRYKVNVSPKASCAEVLDWMNTSNPYAPREWAKTLVRFNWDADLDIVKGDDGYYYLKKLINPRVIMTGPKVDMPQWNPKDAAMKSAWDNMCTILRAHEAQHEKIAQDWKPKLEKRLKESEELKDRCLYVYEEKEKNKAAKEIVQWEWETWLTEHQDEQNKLDPYAAPLECPESESPEEGEGESVEE